MARPRGTLLAVAALAALPMPVAAEGPIDDRVRALEQQLRKAEAQIEQLQSKARQREGVADRARHPKTPRARIEEAHGAVEEGTPSPDSDDPVLLLLETLRKRGTIADSDYEDLKRGILARRQRQDNVVSTAQPPPETAAPPTQETELEASVRRDHKRTNLPVTADYAVGKGLTVRTADRRFDISIRNRLQVRYTFTDQDDPAIDDTSSFRVRRMKTRLRGHILSPSLLYQFQFDFAGSTPRLDSAFLRWKPRRYFGVQAGQYIVPFNRQELTSSGAQQFVDRASPNEFFSPERDQGLTFVGSTLGRRSDRLAWSAGIFNGNGANQTGNENTGHLGVGRLLYMPFGKFNYYVESDVDDTRKPRLGIGAAYAYNSQADSAPKRKARILRDTAFGRFFGINFVDKFDVSQATADVHFKYRGLSVLGDYYWAEAVPNTAPSKIAQGYNIQAGYFIIPRKFEAAVRYAFIDRDMDAPKSGLREIGGALGYFFLAHNLKLQMDVRDIQDEAPLGRTRNTMEYRTQFQAIF